MTSPHGESRRQMPAVSRREQILTAAGGLFAESGYEVTTMEEIAARAGVTKGALFYHFKSKEGILLALLRSHEARFADRLESLKRGPVTPELYLKELLSLRSPRHSPSRMMVADMSMQAVTNPKVGRLIRDAHRRSVRQFVAAMGPHQGYGREELRQIAAFVLSLFHGLNCLQAIDPKIVNIDEQLRLVADLLQRRVHGEQK